MYCLLVASSQSFLFNLLMQFEDAFDQYFGTGRATRNIDIPPAQSYRHPVLFMTLMTSQHMGYHGWQQLRVIHDLQRGKQSALVQALVCK